MFFFFFFSASFFLTFFFICRKTMGQLAASDSGAATGKTSSLERLKVAASSLLKRTPKPSAAAAIAPSSPPPAVASRDYATRGGKAAARSLALLSATSMVSADEEETAGSSTAWTDNGEVVANAVPFSRKSNDDNGVAAKPSIPTAADVAAGRFWLGPPRDLEAKYDLTDKVLGSGGSGIVRLATSKRTGKTVAVKTIPKVSQQKNGRRRSASRRQRQRAEGRHSQRGSYRPLRLGDRRFCSRFYICGGRCERSFSA